MSLIPNLNEPLLAQPVQPQTGQKTANSPGVSVGQNISQRWWKALVDFATPKGLGGILYPQTAAEGAAGVTPVNGNYPANHIFRYITDLDNVLAGTSTVDNSVGAQNWLSTLTPGCTATLIGTVRAQGLVLRISDVLFTGGGWLKPVSNAATATVLQIGEDSSSTYVRRAAGSINIGDRTGFYTNWSNITGLAIQYGAEHQLTLNLDRKSVV